MKKHGFVFICQLPSSELSRISKISQELLFGLLLPCINVFATNATSQEILFLGYLTETDFIVSSVCPPVPTFSRTLQPGTNSLGRIKLLVSPDVRTSAGAQARVPPGPSKTSGVVIIYMLYKMFMQIPPCKLLHGGSFFPRPSRNLPLKLSAFPPVSTSNDELALFHALLMETL